MAAQRIYWQKKLEKVEFSGMIERTHNGSEGEMWEREYEFVLPEEAVEGAERIAGGSAFLLYAVLLSALKICLYRYNRKAMIVVGSPVRLGGEREAGTENLLPIVSGMEGRLGFRELLLQVRETLLEAYQNQEYPMEAFRRALKQKAGERLLEIVMSLKQLHAEPGKQVPVRLELEKAGRQIRGKWSLEEGWLQPERVRQYTEQMIRILRQGLKDVNVRVRDMRWMEEEEQRQLLSEWNRSGAGESSGKLVMELFEEQVRRRPAAVALVYEEGRMSYEELNRLANRLGAYLRKRGVRAEERVVVFLRKRWQIVVGLLGILKAGGAYVPVDPGYPAERCRQILQDAQAAVLLTEQGLKEGLPAGPAREVVCLDSEWTEIEKQSAEDLGRTADVLNMAYVIYTSGSSGTPKGVAVTQEALAERTRALGRLFQMREQDRTLQFLSPSFDAFGGELYTVLNCGATLVVREQSGSQLPAELLEVAERERITVMHMSPAYWMEIQNHVEASGAAMPGELRLLSTGGEPILAEQAWKWKTEHNVDVCNAFGPTETTITSTAYVIGGQGEKGQGDGNGKRAWLPVGRPVANTQVYVLDEEQQVVPAGVAGELYIGGAGVARGYWGHAEQTAERFVPHMFAAGERLYRSGDLVRWNDAGDLEFLQRKDQQVKIRGYRIELGEIEAVLRRHEKVQQAIVEARSEEGGGEGREKRLVGYVVAKKGEQVSGAELRRYLEGKLPEYMIPAVCMIVKQIPLTSGGKPDRKRLPAPVWSSEAEYVAPRTPAEEILSQIWTEVLRLDQVGVDQNFFELGGHSLLATKVISRIQEVFGVEFPLQSMFAASAIRDMAEKITQLKQKGITEGLKLKRIDKRPKFIPLSFAQQRLWFLHQMQPESPVYNMPFVVRFAGDLNVSAMQSSISEIVRRHEVLRTTFPAIDGEPYQRISPPSAVQISLIDISGLAVKTRTQAGQWLMRREAESLFDLERGPLLRVKLIRLSVSEYVLLVTIHHSVSDGWSMELFAREFTLIYKELSHSTQSHLPELPLQYADFAISQREWFETPAFQEHLDYWVNQLRDAPEGLPLADKPRSAVPRHRGERVSFSLPAPMVSELKSICKKEKITLFMMLMAAYQTLLCRYSGQTDIVVGSPIANRNRVETENLIGLFVNQIAFRCSLHDNPGFDELLKRVRKMALDAYAHQDFPFDKLVGALGLKRDWRQSPLFQVWFHFQQQGTVDRPDAMPEVSSNYVGTNFAMAKLDLALFMQETDSGLTGTFVYDADLFEEKTITKMAAHFCEIFTTAAANPSCRLLDISLSEDEKANATMAPRQLEEGFFEFIIN